MNALIEAISQHMTIVVVGATFAIAFISMAVAQMVGSRAREKSRRELAAYVAEGSMTAEEAESLLSAGAGRSESGGGCCNTRRRKSSAPPMSAEA